jgi:hypothetical protein
MDATKACEFCREHIKVVSTPLGKLLSLNLYKEIVSEELKTKSMYLINNAGEAICINNLKETFQMAYTEHVCLIYKKTFKDPPAFKREKLPPAEKYLDPVAFAMSKWDEHRAKG